MMVGGNPSDQDSYLALPMNEPPGRVRERMRQAERRDDAVPGE